MAETFEDFYRKYQDCFVILDKTTVAYCRVNDGNMLAFDTRELGTVLLKPTAKNFERVSHFFPHRGLYNIDDQLVSFSRTTNRQWKRGISNKTTRLVSILNVVETSPQYTLKTVEQLFYPKYPKSLTKGLQTPRFTSCALSPFLGITLSDKVDYDAMLWYNHVIIGHISVKDKQIKLHSDLFFDEVKEYLNNTNEGLSWNLTIQEQ